MQKFNNKRVVITGGSSGIGLAAAQLFGKAGAEVYITGRQKDSVDKEAGNAGVTGLVSDQSSLTDIAELVKQVTKNGKKVDVLFINAGIAAFAPVAAVSEDHYDSIMDINVKGALFTLQQFIPHLNQGAAVIFLSSINAYNAMENSAVYAASKAALNAIAKVAAVELAPRSVRVNVVSPGPVNTPIWTKVGLTEEQLTQMAGLIQGKVPLKKFGSPEEIARAVLFLASEESSFTTGAEFVVDGGFNLHTMIG